MDRVSTSPLGSLRDCIVGRSSRGSRGVGDFVAPRVARASSSSILFCNVQGKSKHDIPQYSTIQRSSLNCFTWVFIEPFGRLGLGSLAQAGQLMIVSGGMIEATADITTNMLPTTSPMLWATGKGNVNMPM
ncbi:hypothetical protein FSOLCH5_004230 [Fusarium solani]